ncbi:MAG: hypothetical protein J7M32_01330 [Deltaproteobacteria bacterium]|nr:hypothetical protein [Deltaproteobacteria bacterium]
MKMHYSTNHLISCKGLFALMLLAIFCTVCIGPAMAHRVTIFAWVQGDKIFTESKFSGGKRVKGGKVIVYDLAGKQLLEGKTDDRGEFSFKIPGRTSMKIVLQAGMGHRAEWTIPASEFAPPGSKSEPAVSKNEGLKMSEVQTATSGMSLEQIRRVVDQSLDQKLTPIMKILVESRESGPAARDVFGGIGYILGLMGVGAYFNYRRKTAEIERKKPD